MSDMGAALDILGTNPQLFLAILLLRTIAIYAGSGTHVIIPLLTAYVVRPQDKHLGLCGSLYIQASVAAGIIVNCYFLRVLHGQ